MQRVFVRSAGEYTLAPRGAFVIYGIQWRLLRRSNCVLLAPMHWRFCCSVCCCKTWIDDDGSMPCKYVWRSIRTLVICTPYFSRTPLFALWQPQQIFSVVGYTSLDSQILNPKTELMNTPMTLSFQWFLNLDLIFAFGSDVYRSHFECAESLAISRIMQSSSLFEFLGRSANFMAVRIQSLS